MEGFIMNGINILKTVVSFVVGAGTAKITHAIIDNNVDPETRGDKISVYAGTAALTGMAMERSKAYTDDKIDELVDALRLKKSKKEKTHNITEM